jgi:predicted phosphodiesterase
MRLGVISDVHWTETPTDASWHGPFDFAGLPRRLERALDEFRRAGVDAIVACGDLTHFGDAPSARAVLERLPALVLAGNHDCEERDDRLKRCGARMLERVEIDGVHVAGVAIESDAEGCWWTGGPVLLRADVVASHFPVLSRAERLAAEGLKYAGDLVNRLAVNESVDGEEPAVVLSGHIHCRETHVHGNLLQLSAGALIEAPHEAAIVDVVPGRVRRRVVALGAPPRPGDPVLAPPDETWAFAGAGWQPA